MRIFSWGHKQKEVKDSAKPAETGVPLSIKRDKVEMFTPELLIKDHFRRVTQAWPRDRAGDWARQLVRRIEQQELGTISLLAHGKMSESLSDGERHSTAISKDDL